MTFGQGQGATGSGDAPGYHQLRVWRTADDLAVHIYETTADLTRTERWLASQIRRAAASVPAKNLTERYGSYTLFSSRACSDPLTLSPRDPFQP